MSANPMIISPTGAAAVDPIQQAYDASVCGEHQCCACPLATDVQTAEFPLRLGPRDFDRFDPCVGLGRLVPLDARLDHGPVAFENRLHASIPSVLDISVKSQRLRLLRTVRSKVDPLHASEKDNDRADFHREAKRSSAKELYRGDGRFVRSWVDPRLRLSRVSGTGRRTVLIRHP